MNRWLLACAMVLSAGACSASDSPLESLRGAPRRADMRSAPSRTRAATCAIRAPCSRPFGPPTLIAATTRPSSFRTGAAIATKPVSISSIPTA